MIDNMEKFGQICSTNEFVECQFRDFFYDEMVRNVYDGTEDTSNLKKYYRRMLERKEEYDTLIIVEQQFCEV